MSANPQVFFYESWHCLDRSEKREVDDSSFAHAKPYQIPNDKTDVGNVDVLDHSTWFNIFPKRLEQSIEVVGVFVRNNGGLTISARADSFGAIIFAFECVVISWLLAIHRNLARRNLVARVS